MPVVKDHIKVLFISPPYLPIPPVGYGGIEKVAEGLIPALLRAGCEVTVTSPIGTTVECSDLHELTVGLYPIISNHYGPVSIPTQAYDAKVRLIAASKDFDIIHDYTGIFSALVSMGSAILANDKFPPVFHTIHGSYCHSFKNGADKMYNLMCQYPRINFHGISNAQIVEAPPHIRSRMSVVHNGIHVEDSKLGNGGSGRMFVLGRVCYDKGQDRLVDFAVKEGMGLDIAGPVAEICSWDEIKYHAKNNTPASQKHPFKTFQTFEHLIDGELVKFHGNVVGDHKASLLENAAVLVVPNRWKEPFGMVVVEAMACGTPVVACHLGAMPELIKNGVSGYCGKDWDDVCDYLRRQEYLKIDRAGVRKYVDEQFGINNLGKKMKRVYQRIIENGITHDATVEELVTGGFYVPTVEDLLMGNPKNIDMKQSIEIWERNAALIKPEDRVKFQAVRHMPDGTKINETWDTLQARFDQIREIFELDNHNLGIAPALKPGAVLPPGLDNLPVPYLDDEGHDPYRGHVEVKSIALLPEVVMNGAASDGGKLYKQEQTGACCGGQAPSTDKDKVDNETPSLVTAILNNMDIAHH